MRWVVVGVAVSAACTAYDRIETQTQQGQDVSRASPPAGGPGGQGGSGGQGLGGAPTCAEVTTCPGTTSGRWCVETLAGQPAISLEGVWSDGPNDAWAVGWQTDPNVGTRSSVQLHWDGCAWTDVPNPAPTDFLFARGVWGVAANDVWIVGDGGGALRFDGKSLHFVPMPLPPDSTVVDIPSASGNASDDIWTGGDQALHWDGATWTAVPIDTGDPNPYFGDVWSVAPDDVWLAGDQIVAHFDGSSWTVTRLITGPIGSTSFLYAIWSSGAQAWAAGPGGRIHHFQGGQWTQTVAPTDAGPLLSDLGGLDGDLHLVGTRAYLDVFTNDAFAPVTDAPPQGGSYSSVWVSPSQVWVVGANQAGEPMIIRRAR